MTGDPRSAQETMVATVVRRTPDGLTPRADAMRFARGFRNALVVCLPFWAVVGGLVLVLLLAGCRSAAPLGTGAGAGAGSGQSAPAAPPQTAAASPPAAPAHTVATNSFAGSGPAVLAVDPPADVDPRASVWLDLRFHCDGSGPYSVTPTGDDRLGAHGVECGRSTITYRFRVADVTRPNSLTVDVAADAGWELQTETLVGGRPGPQG